MSHDPRTDRGALQTGEPLLDAYRILRDQHNVSDEDWRSLVSDSVGAAQVADIIRRNGPAGVDGALRAWLGADDIGFVDPRFMIPETDPRWNNKGAEAGREYVFIHMQRPYLDTEVCRAVRRHSRGLRQPIRVATAYELAYVAAHEHSGEWFAAFGSSFIQPDGSRDIPYSWCEGNGPRRMLGFGKAKAGRKDKSRWSERILVLCVITS